MLALVLAALLLVQRAAGARAKAALEDCWLAEARRRLPRRRPSARAPVMVFCFLSLLLLFLSPFLFVFARARVCVLAGGL